MNEVIYNYNDVTYTAEYFIFDDQLTITLPDGSQPEIMLRGLDAESTALSYLRRYAHKQGKISAQ